MASVPILRPARKGDIKQMVRIQDMWTTTPGWKGHQFEQELESSYMVVAALPNGEIAGYSGLRNVLDEGHITTIAVHPSQKRKGIGKSLLVHLTGKSRAMQLSSLHLEVEASNHPAVCLYKAHGFQIVGRRPNFYNRGRDASLMKLKL